MSTAEGLAKYLVAVIKCTDDADKATKLVEAKLKDLLNSELGAVEEVVTALEKEWGEVAIRCNGITRPILKEISARKIS